MTANPVTVAQRDTAVASANRVNLARYRTERARHDRAEALELAASVTYIYRAAYPLDEVLDRALADARRAYLAREPVDMVRTCRGLARVVNGAVTNAMECARPQMSRYWAAADAAEAVAAAVAYSLDMHEVRATVDAASNPLEAP